MVTSVVSIVIGDNYSAITSTDYCCHKYILLKGISAMSIICKTLEET